ncbi:hypothetical protein SEPCBS119000_001024 [Sporothrix epigloea]|uniref:Uncharacterized protein n=1 Tax=Sporothrix epigloea TaxID=1892477 RepID=A0ABP0DA01_9PEZI
MAEVARPLDPREVLAPLLPSLPVAAIASEPASVVLPLLSPILRQRVQFLSGSSSEPWIRLLAYDPAKAAKLAEIARSARFEPHPVSGEIEIDWDSSTGNQVETRYKRLDVETLQALVLLRDLAIVVRLVHCEADKEGDSVSGWRVSEVSVPDEPHAFALFGGYATAAEAERAFSEAAASRATHKAEAPKSTSTLVRSPVDEEDEDEDDDYWARYDATPARTPAVKRSPAPYSSKHAPYSHSTATDADADADADADDAYFSQYDSVQPAMDNHDPDEVMDGQESLPSGLTGNTFTSSAIPSIIDREVVKQASSNEQAVVDDEYEVDHEWLASLKHPRPASASSHSSSAGGKSAESAVLVTKLEQSAGRQEQSEFGVKQHVSRSIKSLYLLARASGIDRDEFEQLVKMELDMLSMLAEE